MKLFFLKMLAIITNTSSYIPDFRSTYVRGPILSAEAQAFFDLGVLHNKQYNSSKDIMTAYDNYLVNLVFANEHNLELNHLFDTPNSSN